MVWKSMLALALIGLTSSGCMSTGGTPDISEDDIPEDAVATTRTLGNGDVVTEYRVGTQLRVVKIVPVRGPTYYLYDRNRDGIVDKDDRVPMTYYTLFEW